MADWIHAAGVGVVVCTRCFNDGVDTLSAPKHAYWNTNEISTVVFSAMIFTLKLEHRRNVCENPLIRSLFAPIRTIEWIFIRYVFRILSNKPEQHMRRSERKNEQWFASVLSFDSFIFLLLVYYLCGDLSHVRVFHGLSPVYRTRCASHTWIQMEDAWVRSKYIVVNGPCEKKRGREDESRRKNNCRHQK